MYYCEEIIESNSYLRKREFVNGRTVMQIETKIMKQVKNVLRQFGTKYITEGSALKRSTVISDLDKYDHDLMTALLSNQLIHDEYTEIIANTEVFKLNQFINMFEYKEFWEDSFTKYANRIGLASDNKFISDSSDVVLNFPYKDTVLKAGMDKEDADPDEGADEPFLNETLAHAEINELFEPKVLVSAKRYDSDGEKDAIDFSYDDNLIIKGNNLIALHSIEQRYSGKIKMIYLDPPYNTGSDSFEYNDNFNHSAWLTFMKNRIEIARKLLSEDGAIFIQTDDNEMPYLKVLMDDLYGRDNYIGNIIWKKKTGSSDTTSVAIITEYILVYAKNKKAVTFSKNPGSYDEKRYRYKDEYFGERGPFYYDTLDRGGLQYSDSLNYGVKTPDGKVLYPHGRSEFQNDGWIWKWGKEKVEWGLKNGFCEFVKQNGKYKLKYKVYLKVNNKGEAIKREAPWKNIIEGIMNTHASSEINKLFGSKVFATPKPEKLMNFLINLGTFENDIVLDFFMGSATTQATAMKMHRRFIGVEQMDYVNTVSVPRLRKVIEGEQGGISKDVNWQGGGSFVYAELMEKNQGYLRDLQRASNLDELYSVYERMKKGADLDFRVDLAKYESDPGRKNLSFDDQKKLLIKMLDKNQLYYNEANIDDADVRDLVSETDYKFNKSFYGKESE